MTPFKTLKCLVISLSTIAVILAGSLLSPVHAAGTVPLALSVQVDSTGAVAPGCLLNFFVAGTVATPQNAFADFGLTTPMSNPIQCDQGGRLPMFWLADGLIHIRLTTSSGNPIVDTTMQVLGPSSGGGGGGGTVDPTSIMATGDEKIRYGTGPISGWVRENGLTIGSAVSGATERANADTQALFIYLYTTDPNLIVSGGRTGNALTDFNANKTIATPDMRGRVNAFLDDMGAPAAGRLTATYFGSAATVLGAPGGSQSVVLAPSQIPSITSATGGAVTVFVPGGSSLPLANSIGISSGPVPTSGGVSVPFNLSGAPSWSALTSLSTAGVIGVTSNNTGGLPHPTLPPMMLKTSYIKL